MLPLMPSAPAPTQPLVIDTNTVLDLFVFEDPASAPLRAALDAGVLRWLATAHMREELARVLAYPHLVMCMTTRGVAAADVLAAFDRHCIPVDAAERCAVRCRDTDDQPFIDLAIAHGARLVSKDKLVLATAKRVALHGASVLHPSVFGAAA
jgi:predicted nucleic acid-binding protein